MLAARHATTQPDGLKHLILASAPADMELWVKTQNALRTELPDDVQEILKKNEKDETTQSDEYQAAMGVFYSRFLCRIDPFPDPVAKALGSIDVDPTVYLTM